MLFIFIYLDLQPQNTQARTCVSLCEYANMFSCTVGEIKDLNGNENSQPAKDLD